MRKRLFAIIFVVLLAVSFSCISFAASASVSDYSAPSRLTVELEISGKTVPGAKVNVWRVGDFADGFSSFVLAEPFVSKFDVSKVTDSDHWDSLASKMLAFVKSEGIAPSESIATDGVGRAYFGILDCGLYLAECEETEYDGSLYRFLPFLVSLPEYIDADGGTWIYDVAARPKPGASPIPQTGVLWQPVFILTGVGIVLLGIGVFVKCKKYV